MGTYKARYASGGTANDPTVAIPELMHSMVVIAAREADLTPGKFLERALFNELVRHSKRMEELDYGEVCRQAVAASRSAPQRWEFDRMRTKRKTDPRGVIPEIPLFGGPPATMGYRPAGPSGTPSR